MLQSERLPNRLKRLVLVYIRNPNLIPNRALILSRGTIRGRVKSHFGVFGHPLPHGAIASSPHPRIL